MKRGRPPLPPEQRRTEHVGVRFSRAELNRLYSESRIRRIAVGELLRRCVLSELASRQTVPVSH